MSSKRNKRVDVRRQADRQLVTTQVAFSGPLPHPGLLEKYEQAFPGSADRILKQWESQTAHRQGLENRAVDANISNSRRGQWFALIVSLVVIAVGGGLIWSGRDGQGFSLIVGQIAALAGVFVAGRRQQAKELNAKRAAVEQAARTVQYE